MSDYTVGFERWWKAYPAYKRKGKGAAFKRWTERNLEPRTADLVDVVERQSQYDDHFKKYTPMPATYLHQGRYDDDVPKPPRATVPNMVQVDDNHEKDPYRSAVKRVAFNWLMRRRRALPEDLLDTFIKTVHSLADDARDMHERGELTDGYAQTIRDNLDDFMERHA